MVTLKQLKEAEMMKKYYDEIITQYWIEESNRNERRKIKMENEDDMEGYSNDRAYMTGERQLATRLDCNSMRGKATLLLNDFAKIKSV